MTFDEILGQVLQLLQRQGRVSYRALKRRFNLDDEYLEDLKAELIKAQRVAVDEDGDVLVWTGSPGRSPAPGGDEQHAPSALQAAPPRAQPEDHTAPIDWSPAQRGIPEAERRQLTVLFCDLVDSTSLAAHLDPEDWREVIRAYQQACAEVIGRFGGYIAQYLGDGLLVYFGYPQAHEDDAQRAIRTGLGMVDALGQLNARLVSERGIQVAVRVGIHTGLVVVGEIGGGGRQEQLALGDTPNIAARLQALADADTVVLSATTYRLIQGFFTCHDLGAQSLKGVATPVQVYRVLGESEAQSRLDVVSPRGLTPLVGRETEVAVLRERWAQARDGLGQIVLLSGEAGIGKSRLVLALKEHVAGESHTRWECRGSPYFRDSALYPVIDLSQRALQFGRDESPEAKLQKIEAALGRYGLAQPETVALWAALLSVPLADPYPSLTLTPQRQKQKTLDAIVALLLALAAEQPVLLIVEDVHWIDPSTLEFLTLLIDQGPTARLLTLLTCRPEFHAPWGFRAHLTPLTLTRLPRPQAAQMSVRVAGGKALPPEVVQQIVAKTDGVPLFVEELTKTVLESGLLREREDQYELMGPLPPLAIPATLHDSLMARLDRLATVKDVAQLGATIGRTFAYELLQAVSPLDDATLQQGLRQLVEAEFLYQRGIAPQATYVFKHALIQDAAYQSLLRSTRQQYHQRIAQVLAAQFPETAEMQPELLAHHYTEAGLSAQAIPYWQQAGQRALERSATLEAVAHLTKGLEVLGTLPDTPERAQQELAMQITLGPALMTTKGFLVQEVEHAYTQARALCQQVGDARQLFSALWGLWYLHLVRGQLQRAHEVGEELLGVARQLHDPELFVVAHRAVGNASFWRGELSLAHTHAQQALARYNPQQMRDHAVRYGQDSGVTCRLFGAVTLWLLGYPDQARQWSKVALTHAQGLRHAFTLQQALVFSAILHQLRREAAVALERAEAQRVLCTEHGFADYLSWGTVLWGSALAAQGAWAEGLAQMREGLAAYRPRGRVPWLLFLGLLAEACERAGQVEEGLRALHEALEVMQTSEERLYEAEVYRLRGELLLQQSTAQQGEAEASLQQALTVARRQQAKSWELRAAMSLSRLWQGQGKQEEARQLLAQIYGWFTEGFDTPDLQEARALLAALS
jgi:TOMM system kinase/cyclase fusion protein